MPLVAPRTIVRIRERGSDRETARLPNEELPQVGRR